MEDRSLLNLAPTGVDLLAASDTGFSDVDGVTSLDNSSFDRALQFEVSGTNPSATVLIYADGVLIGSAPATGQDTIVTTDGAYDLADGDHAITARQIKPGEGLSGESPALALAIDTQAPMMALDPTVHLTADDAGVNREFGYAVAIDGASAIIGSPWQDNNYGMITGAAYVFEDTGSGWTQAAKLTPPHSESGARFGCSVCISGSVAAIGAMYDDARTNDSGSVTVFENTGAGWTQVVELTPLDAREKDYFGTSVAISENRIIVGAYGDDDRGSSSGSAYVFENSGSGWVEVAKLTAADGAADDCFGYSVSISGSLALVGAYGDDNDAGSVYVFEDTGSGWTQRAKLTAADRAANDCFGYSVSTNGNVGLIGAHGDDDLAASSGAAYLFEKTGSGWVQLTKWLPTDCRGTTYFGRSVSISQTMALVGAYNDSIDIIAPGSAYLFAKTSAGWTPFHKLFADDGAAGDRFGYSVAISGAAAIVGANRDDDGGSESGSAYILGPAMLVADDTGRDGDDRLTSDTTPRLTFRFTEPVHGAAGDVGVLDPSGNPVVPDAVEGWGTDTLAIALTSPLTTDGDYRVTLSGTATIADAAGNPICGGLDAAAGFTLDATAPAAPAAPDLRAASDTGASDNDNVTANNRPTFDVVGAPYFRVYRDGVQISGDYATGTSYTASVQPDGTYEYTVTAVDEAGNESAPSDPLAVTIDTQAPDAPAAPDLQAASDTGVSDTDNLTKDTTPTFDVTAAPYFRLYRGTTQVSGDYESGTSCTATPQPDGTYDYTIREVDAAGNESGPSPSLSVTIDTASPIRTEQIGKVLAGDSAASDYFGESVSISGDVAIVGAYRDDDRGTNSGSAYIFNRTGSGWTQVAKLRAGDGAAGDYFGYSVSISGSVAIVGAYHDDDRGSDSGSVYIFENAGSGWAQVAKLTAADGSAADYFGTSVSISGSIVIVGASGNDDQGSSSGSAYIFEKTGSDWTQTAKLLTADGAAGDYFGDCVSISGSMAIIGAYGDDEHGSSSGSAYIFGDAGSGWEQVAKLAAADGAADDYFGFNVSISGFTAVVGAHYDDDNGSASGSAYVFENAGPGWMQVAKLTAADGAPADFFGSSVSISGSMTIVGAQTADPSGGESGAAYLFENTGSSWVQVAKLAAADGTIGDHFGYSVSISGNTALIGACYDDDSGADSGSAYSFGVTHAADVAVLQAASDTGADNADNVTSDVTPMFEVNTPGCCFQIYRNGVKVSGDFETGTTYTDSSQPDGIYEYAVVAVDAAGNESLPSDAVTVTIDTEAPAAPAAPDLQTASDSGVSSTDNVTNDATPTFDAAGAPYFRLYRDGVQISGDYESDTYTAAMQADGVYSYAVTSVDAAGNESALSSPLTVTIDTVAPPVPAAPDLQAGSDRGTSDTDNLTSDTTPTFDVTAEPYFRVYRDSTKISGNYEAGGSFTPAVQPSGTYAYSVAAVDAAGNESAKGLSLTVTIDTTGPFLINQIAKLLAGGGLAGDSFGYNVAISGKLALVGAERDDEVGQDAGAAYVFEETSSGWTQVAKLTADDGNRSDYFGCSVAIDGNVVIVGADGDDNGKQSGSAYIFERTGAAWTQTAKLTPPPGTLYSRFGARVSISGHLAIVGLGVDQRSPGAAYVFEKMAGGWTPVAELTPVDGTTVREFGTSVSIHGSTAIVGAYADTYLGYGTGSAYLFEDAGSGWVQIARLTASDAAVGDYFGRSVSISDSVALVGANGDDDRGGDSGSAYVFEFSGSGWTQVAKLRAADGATGDDFGWSVSISGETAVIGAYRDDDKGTDSGSAYRFEKIDAGWEQVSKLTAADGATGDYFGYSVAVSDSVTIVGAYQDDDLGSSSRSAYLFGNVVELSEDTGVEAHDGVTSDTTPELTFSFSEPVYGQAGDVAVLDPAGNPVVPDVVTGWGTSMLVIGFTTALTTDGEYTVTLAADGIADGAGNPINGGTDVTASFTLDTTAPAAPTTAPDLVAACDKGISDTDDLTNDNTPVFSATVASLYRVYCDGVLASGDCLGDSGPTMLQSDGAHQYTITVVDAAGNESAAGPALIVTIDTAPPEAPSIAPDLQAASDSGLSDTDDVTNDATPTFDVSAAPYFRIYRNGILASSEYESGGVCTLPTQPDGTYPYTVRAIDAAGNESTAGPALSVTIDTFGPIQTEQVAKLLAGDGAAGGWFGYSVSIDGNVAVVGAYCNGTAPGAAYVFENTASGWIEVARLTASDPDAKAQFGRCVSIDDSTIVVGSPGKYGTSGEYSGAAYVFEDTGSGWTQVAKLTAADPASGDYFGYSAAISGNEILIGSYYDDDRGTNSGSAYVFTDAGLGWSQAAKLVATDGAADDLFGYSVAISGAVAIVGVPGDDDMGGTSGSAYVFEDSGSGWTQVAKLVAPDGVAGDCFGLSVSTSGNAVLVGSPQDDDRGTNSGSVYAFQDTGAGWVQAAKLAASDGEAGDLLGISVSVSGATVLVGACGDDDKGSNSGSAYLFQGDGSEWAEVAKLTASDGAPSDNFGRSVAISGLTPLVGAYSNDDQGDSSGSAYVFGPGARMIDDTGADAHDRVTNDTTPELAFTFVEPVHGEPGDVTVLDPNQQPIVPDSITGWGTNTLVVAFTTPLTIDGTYSVTLDSGAIADAAGNPIHGGDDQVVTFALDTLAPTVNQLLVKGSAWDEAFLDYLDSAGLGQPGVARLGYQLPTGAAQLDPLAWSNIDTITIVFNEDVGATQNLLTIAGANSSAAYPISDFSYNATTHAATWTLAAPVNADRLVITLADAVEDPAGNRLDGEWQNAASEFPAGNGTPGGDFSFTVNVLPGDANHDGVVNAGDASILAANWGNHGATLVPADFTGDGAVDTTDAAVLAGLWGTALPAWRPGDANRDGTVDAADAQILAAHWGRSDMTWAEGDFNDDGVVNAADASILAANWGTTLPGAEEEPVEPSEPIGPVVVDDGPFVGPLPVGGTVSTRQPIRPAQRAERAAPMMLGAPAEGPSSKEAAAARDAVLAKQYGLQFEPPFLDPRPLARSYTLAHRQTHERQRALDPKALAIDVFLSDLWT